MYSEVSFLLLLVSLAINIWQLFKIITISREKASLTSLVKRNFQKRQESLLAAPTSNNQTERIQELTFKLNHERKLSISSLEHRDEIIRKLRADLLDEKKKWPSRGARKVVMALRELGIRFRDEFKILSGPLKKRRYDFAFFYKNKKYILEFDGKQHWKGFDLDEKKLQENQQVDQMKTEVAVGADFNVIRISYKEEKEILFHLKTALEKEMKVYVSNPELYAKIGIHELK
jgi:very-short-patch-repair endonuclease